MHSAPDLGDAPRDPTSSVSVQGRQGTGETATVVIRIGGGLGNQLFQYAFGRRMALANDANLVLDASGYQTVRESDPRLGVRALGLDHFNIKGTLTTQASPEWGYPSPLPSRPWIKRKFVKWSRKLMELLQSRTPYHLRKIVIEHQNRHFTFDPLIHNRSVLGTVVFEGYWQTEKYFLEIETLIREELKVMEPMDYENTRIAGEMGTCDSIAIHVRHGDNASGVETGLGTLPRVYYDRAISELRAVVKDPRFFVFSEDIEWARAMLQLGSEAVFVSHNDDMHNYEDLRLMSTCRHHITANSTFSWWGAWLGRKEGQIVYAPRRYWQNVDRPNPDLYPGAWRLI